MRLPGVLVLVSLLLAGCTADPAPSPTPSPTPSSTPIPEASGCPAETSLREELCLAEGTTPDELSGILHSQFADAQLNAVVAGVWHDGEPVLVGALGESMTGVPATADMHHLLGNLSTPMFTT